MFKVFIFLFAVLLLQGDLKAADKPNNKNISVINADSFEKSGDIFYLRGNYLW